MAVFRRKFTREVKMAAVRRLETGSSIAEAARAFEVNPNVLHRWRREFRMAPGNVFPGAGKRRCDETEKAKLEGKIGQQTLEIDFLIRVLATHRGAADVAGLEWKTVVYQHIQQEVRGETVMSIEWLCVLANVSRAGFYRFLTTPEAGDTDIDLRDAIQRIALEFPSYGRPRITAELHRRGWQVGQNRVYRIMREAGSPLGLLWLRRLKFVITTNSNHGRPV
jgi:transposase